MNRLNSNRQIDKRSFSGSANRPARFARVAFLSGLAIMCMFDWNQALAIQVDSTSRLDVATITAAASVSSVQVAEPFTFELNVIAPLGSKVEFPPLEDRLAEFDVINHQDIFDIPFESSNQRKWTRRVTLECIVTGNLKIPPIGISVSTEKDSTTLTSNSIPIRVVSVLEDRADPTKFRNIQSVVNVPALDPKSTSWFWWTLGSLAAFGLVRATAIAIVAISRRKKWKTPGQWATNELDRLERSSLVHDGNSELVSRELSTILRDYLELQFDISVPGQTPQQLLETVAEIETLESETVQGFEQIFATADQAKFAGLQFNEVEMKSSIHKGRKLVEQVANEVGRQKPNNVDLSNATLINEDTSSDDYRTERS